MTRHQLEQLEPGQILVYGGNRYVTVDAELAAAFKPGDRLLIEETAGEILHLRLEDIVDTRSAVDAAVDAFGLLTAVTDNQITDFFELFAAKLSSDVAYAPIVDANRADIDRARRRGRSTTRLELSATMRSDMIAGLHGWATSPARRALTEQRLEHGQWSVEALRAPLGVIGFVFEGRPNVFADAVGVVRTGNTVVFRIGSDALQTAKAIVEHALQPALADAGLPSGTVQLVNSATHAAGWALFADSRLALAVARGSGPAVNQLGGIARQVGNAVSLHGTGGAWVIAAPDADADRFSAVVEASLDRKVCNTLNTICVVAERADLLPKVATAVAAAGGRRGTSGRIHATAAAISKWREVEPNGLFDRNVEVQRADGIHNEPFISEIDSNLLGVEWEWENSPEVTVHVVADLAEAVHCFNSQSPRFVVSLISESPTLYDSLYATIDAPFVGNGFTRWVDGQYALSAPELGLSNWENGRLLGRGGILSGDSMYTVRYRATMTDPQLRR